MSGCQGDTPRLKRRGAKIRTQPGLQIQKMEKMNIFIESTKFIPRLVDDKLLPVKIQPRQQ